VSIVPKVSKTGYLPVIDASPTEMLTVYAILEYSLDIADKLGLESIVVILDQPTQVNAQQIQWQNEVFFK